MFNYLFKLAIISTLFLSGYCVAGEIFKWVDKDGVEHYSNDPTQVPYGNWISTTTKKSPAKGNEVDDGASKSDNIEEVANNLPEDSKKHLNNFLEVEKKLNQLISSKNDELDNLRKQGDASNEELLELENFILQAEDKLRIVTRDKNEFLKKNNLLNNQ